MLASAVSAPLASASFYAVIDEGVVPGLDSGFATATCGAGSPVGGGFDSFDDAALRTLQSNAIVPAGYDTWRAVLWNGGGAPADLSVAVICASHLRQTTVVTDSFAAFGSFVIEETVLCPFGRTAYHGGSTASGPEDLTFAVADSPYFFETGMRLRDLDDGPGPAPSGWLVARSGDSSQIGVHSALAQVICGSAAATTQIVSHTVQPGAIGSAIAVCPEDTVAVGGGADADDLDDLELVASGPLFAGHLFPVRLAGLTPGTAEAPIAWRVALRNTGSTARPFKAAAVCVPEPAAGALAAAMVGALAGCAAARARRAGDSDATPD